MDSAFEFIRDHGIETEKAYPYTARTSTCASVDKPEAFKISGYTDVPAGNCDELAKALTI